MDELRQLAANQDGVLRLEQVEEWVNGVISRVRKLKDETAVIAGARATHVGEDEYEDDPYYEGKKHAYGDVIGLLRKDSV